MQGSEAYLQGVKEMGDIYRVSLISRISSLEAEKKFGETIGKMVSQAQDEKEIERIKLLYKTLGGKF